MEPFLTKYQSAKPLAPFLYDDVKQLLQGFLAQFVKEKVLQDAKSMKKLIALAECSEPSHSNFKPATSIDIGKLIINSSNKELINLTSSYILKIFFNLLMIIVLIILIINHRERCISKLAKAGGTVSVEYGVLPTSQIVPVQNVCQNW